MPIARDLPAVLSVEVQTLGVIRVVLPAHLRTLARVDGEVRLDVNGKPTQRSLLDALESRYPVLRGTIRDHVTQKPPRLRSILCLRIAILSHERPDAPLPHAVARARSRFSSSAPWPEAREPMRARVFYGSICAIAGHLPRWRPRARRPSMRDVLDGVVSRCAISEASTLRPTGAAVAWEEALSRSAAICWTRSPTAAIYVRQTRRGGKIVRLTAGTTVTVITTRRIRVWSPDGKPDRVSLRRAIEGADAALRRRSGKRTQRAAHRPGSTAMCSGLRGRLMAERLAALYIAAAHRLRRARSRRARATSASSARRSTSSVSRRRSGRRARCAS